MFLSSVDFFSKSTFSKNYFRNTIRVSNSAAQGQARRSVEPDLGPNCLQRLSADGTKRQIANYQLSSKFWCNDCSSFNSRDVFLFWVFCYLPPIGLDKSVNLFLFFHESICCRYSLRQFKWVPQQMFLLKNKKDRTILCKNVYLWLFPTISETSQRSRMI